MVFFYRIVTNTHIFNYFSIRVFKYGRMSPNDIFMLVIISFMLRDISIKATSFIIFSNKRFIDLFAKGGKTVDKIFLVNGVNNREIKFIFVLHGL